MSFFDFAGVGRSLCCLCERPGRCYSAYLVVELDGFHCAAGAFNSLARKSIKFKSPCLQFDNNKCYRFPALVSQSSVQMDVEDILSLKEVNK